MVEQVEKLQHKLNISKSHHEEEYNENENIQRIFSEEKRFNTGHFNSKANDEKQMEDIYRLGRKNSFLSVNMNPVLKSTRNRSQQSKHN
jgi:hypothetical protein